MDATLAFAQSDAGTAFCIREDGLLLTAAHCVAEMGMGTGAEAEAGAVGKVVWGVMPVGEEEEDNVGDGDWDRDRDGDGGNEDGEYELDGEDVKGERHPGSRYWWSGGLERVKVKDKDNKRPRPRPRSRIIGARCIAWDQGRDLALLKVTHAQPSRSGEGEVGNRIRKFPCVKLPPRTFTAKSKPGRGKSSYKEPPVSTPLVAIGHPSDEHPDDPPGIKAYGSEHRRVLQLSSGRYLGIAPDKMANPQDNSDTGAMRHDCWTYWGYSGGPVFERDSGVLVGVHVDWNPEEPLVKRAVPWVAVEGFLEENGFWG